MSKVKLSKKQKWIFSIIAILLLGVGGGVFYFYSQFNQVEIDKSDEALGINKEEPIVKNTEEEKPKVEEVVYNRFDNQIINIALFGLDRRQKGDSARADSTMILTVDFKHNQLKLSSLMRDMYVDIEGHGKTKFNHAYAYGGATLTMKTINQNFGTDIRDYVSVDFFTLEKIIDEIGGVTINVSEEEYPLVNEYMREVANLQNEKGYPELNHAGEQLLTGKQAVSYARIRKVGNGDFERTERQRIVLSQMVSQIQELNKTEIPALIMKVLPYVETSLDTTTIIDMGMQYLTKGIKEVRQDRFPRDGYWSSLRTDAWYMDFDHEATTQQLQDFIYGAGETTTESEFAGAVEEETDSNNIVQ